MSFKNKIIWITGASSGIGEALAYALAKQEATLILSSRKIEALQKVQQRCLKDCKAIYVQVLDLEQHDQIPKIVQQVIHQHGRIDLLINNGGISQRSLAKDTIFEVDQRLMNINYLGTVALTKALLPTFLKQQEGQIVTVTSLTGVLGTPYRSAYAATKHALHGFFDSLRAELVNDNITITIISPGFIKTQVSINAFVGNGTAQGSMDSRQNEGMDVNVFAQKMLSAIAKKKKEVYIGKKEVLMAYIKRYIPWLYYQMIPRVKVK
ncbi:SDR family oxidoreductase [Aureispira anguillae]|uniref:SDR family oxidoreductase n=1 Tax=Aureispira anguillae TaxID=2864201 RepID=A0A915YGN1_9BACT|nr:SDR family oxidoreductase [Aureispira anguillae]BDS12697.1 SDR family oxidoreductase [Aureispira anguillae]